MGWHASWYPLVSQHQGGWTFFNALIISRRWAQETCAVDRVRQSQRRPTQDLPNIFARKTRFVISSARILFVETKSFKCHSQPGAITQMFCGKWQWTLLGGASCNIRTCVLFPRTFAAICVFIKQRHASMPWILIQPSSPAGYCIMGCAYRSRWMGVVMTTCWVLKAGAVSRRGWTTVNTHHMSLLVHTQSREKSGRVKCARRSVKICEVPWGWKQRCDVSFNIFLMPAFRNM